MFSNSIFQKVWAACLRKLQHMIRTQSFICQGNFRQEAGHMAFCDFF